MDLRSRINVALKEAMKARDSTRLSTLRLINAAIKDREIALRGKGDEISVGDDDVLHILGKMVRQRRESVRAYEEGGRLELAEREQDEIGVIESVKAASEIYAPVDGKILETNDAITDSPASVNESPEENAWFYRIRIDDVSQLDGLMEADAYKAFIA